MIKIGLVDSVASIALIEIRDNNDVIKAKYVIDNDAVYVRSIMESHYVEFSFELDHFARFNRSDYIIYDGMRFVLRDNYKPTQVNVSRYKYTLRFDAEEFLLSEALMYYTRQNLKEASWSLTSNAASFLQIIADNANRYFGGSGYSVGVVEPTEVKSLSFNNTNVLDSLTEIAKTFDCEWYIEDRTINLVSKLSFGSEIEFEQGVAVEDMQWSASSKEIAPNRIVAFGSTRNIPRNYRETTVNEGVDAIFQKRLRIPEALGDSIDAFQDMSNEEVVEATVVFDDIYPRRVGSITNVSTKEYTDTDEETGIVTPWNAYRFKDSGIVFSEDYVLEGEELRVVFQSGKLNGLDFAVRFNPDSVNESNPDAQVYEIIRSEDYGAALPNTSLYPAVGDTYILYGFDIKLVTGQYVPLAEQELYDRAVEWLSTNSIDTSICECKTMISYCATRQYNFELGQKIKVIHTLFDAGYRTSRIMGFSKKLINVYDSTYTVGDASKYSTLAAIKDELNELKQAGFNTVASSGGAGVYVIKQFDSTRPTDFNTYSAKASDAKFLNKQEGGTVEKDTTFSKNVQIHGIGIGDVFQNSTFTAGALGTGWQIKRDSNGDSYMEVDNLRVRKEMQVTQLTIDEIKSVGGTILVTLASLVASNVTILSPDPMVFKVSFDNNNGSIPNRFVVGDYAICQQFNGNDIKRYWLEVSAVDDSSITLLSDGSIDIPSVGDEIIQLGNLSNPNRQNAIMISAYGSDAPSIKQYKGINSTSLNASNEVTVISPSGNKFSGTFVIDAHGETKPIYREMGVYVSGGIYRLNDRVSHLGSYWVCIVNTTIATPSEGSTSWRKETAGTTDINNAVNSARTEFNSQFLVLSGEIASKVSQSDFNSLGQRVSTSETNITQLSNSITSTVTTVNNLSSKVDEKNRTYYQDAVPSVPSGGHKVGDIWHKQSLVDSSGNINADSSKNIYQLQYRWNGSVWRQINWSVAKSKIEQTDSSITSIVEKTGINSVGSGSSLYSMIQQTEGQITLQVTNAVSNLQVGGRNLIKSASLDNDWNLRLNGGPVASMQLNGYEISFEVGAAKWSSINSNLMPVVAGEKYTASCRVHDPQDTGGMNWRFYDAGGNLLSKNGHMMRPENGLVGNKYTHTETAPANAVGLRLAWGPQAICTQRLRMWDMQLEEGSIATSWTPAIEDIEEDIETSKQEAINEVSSSLTIVDNKISLKSKTIELNGHTIAKSIEASDLRVGSRSGAAALEVLRNGTFYAKGSGSSNSLLEIDSSARSITIKSPAPSTGMQGYGGANVSCNLTMSASNGGIRIDGVTDMSNYSATNISNAGVFTNTAGQYFAAAGTNQMMSRAGIASLGFGKLAKDSVFDNFITGVYGRASNSLDAPAYGGYFLQLMAKGLVLGIKKIQGSTNLWTQLHRDDSYVLSGSNVQQTVYLPNDAYDGTIIFFKQWGSGKITVQTTNGSIYDDSTSESYYDIPNGRMGVCTYVGVWNINGVERKCWMFNRLPYG